MAELDPDAGNDRAPARALQQMGRWHARYHMGQLRRALSRIGTAFPARVLAVPFLEMFRAASPAAIVAADTPFAQQGRIW